MQRRRVELQPAYLLHARAFRDTSLLLEAFTPEYGRVGLIARGARGPRSKNRANLQPLRPLLLSWNASGELGTLTGVEARGLPAPLAGEPLFCAWYANELLMRLSAREDAHPVLFAAYVALMDRLATDTEPALRAFERCLLEELGYGLRLPDDLDAGWHYRYDWEQGPLPASAADGEGYSGASLIALRDDRLTEAAARRDARRLLRQALQRQLGSRPLESGRLLRELRGLAVVPVTSDA